MYLSWGGGGGGGFDDELSVNFVGADAVVFLFCFLTRVQYIGETGVVFLF